MQNVLRIAKNKSLAWNQVVLNAKQFTGTANRKIYCHVLSNIFAYIQKAANAIFCKKFAWE